MLLGCNDVTSCTAAAAAASFVLLLLPLIPAGRKVIKCLFHGSRRHQARRGAFLLLFPLEFLSLNRASQTKMRSKNSTVFSRFAAAAAVRFCRRRVVTARLRVVNKSFVACLQ